jgi:hypothetical protein
MLQSPDSGLIARLRADAAPLRDSFAAAAADPRAFAADFYHALFELAPGVRGLFPEDLQSQREKFQVAPAGALVRASNCRALPVHFLVRKGRKGRKESRSIPSCVGFPWRWSL